MFRPNSRSVPSDPFAFLGIDSDADVEMIHDARRSLAKQRHPDVGGSVAAMQEVNAAAEAALASVSSRGARGVRSPTPSRPSRPRRSRPRPGPRGDLRRDHPSFTIEALPVEAFEGLLLASAEIGELVDDDPPYLIEVLMASPPAWCRLELVPDAGASTVSITTARVPGHPTPDVADVRDRWIDVLNRLDWPDPDASPTL